MRFHRSPILLALCLSFPASAQEQGSPTTVKPGVKLFTDRKYTLVEAPEFLLDRPFLRTSIEGYHVECVEPGDAFVMTLSQAHNANQSDELIERGFKKMNVPEFQLFAGQVNRVLVWRKRLEKGERLNLKKLAFLVLGDGTELVDYQAAPPGPWSANTGEKLYNGIVLPSVWPPRHYDQSSDAPMTVPYLDHPPNEIPIDIGRQLFVDDFLIHSTDLKRQYHRAEKFEDNPVFVPESESEIENGSTVYLGQGGVFFDPTEKIFKMFYTAGWRGPLAMATSQDLKNWTRPNLGLFQENWILPVHADQQDSETHTSGSDNAVWYDITAEDPRERIKFLTCWMHEPKNRPIPGIIHSLQISDGKTWSEPVPLSEKAADYGSIFYNPFRKKWVQSIKQGGPRGRSRRYSENNDFIASADTSDSVYWTNADRLDQPEPEDSYPGDPQPPQLYSLSAVAYESLMIGMHQIHRGPPNGVCQKGEFPKLTDLELGFSRDGFHWHRPDRRGFIRGERREGSWDRAYVHTTTGIFVVLDDQLVFPYCAYSGTAEDGRKGIYTGGSIGLAMLRRDGFASMDANNQPGTLTTRPLTFSGSHLFVNVDCPAGKLRVEVLDKDGKPIAPFILENCLPISTDSTLAAVQWKDENELASIAGQPVRLRFELTNGSLYSFWVSKDRTGRSDGYLAAGGPGYPGIVDTVGRAASK